MTSWNMVDAVTQPGGLRAFCPPLADLGADTSLFEILEERATGGNPEVTLDVGLRIRVKAPAGGFQPADPLLRLNALGRAEVRFYPAGQQTVAGIGEIKRDSLVLYIAHWAQWFRTVAWWQNWVQADCLPATFVYENVDRAELQSMLQSAPLTDDAFPIFPRGVTQANRAGFIASFLQGSRSVGARAGDYLGRAGPETAGAVEPSAARLLTFHAHYQGHLAPAARPMNPRELFHLLFGDDSQEAKTHPLLLRIDEVGRLAQEIDHDSMRMLLRPPLRTSKRVEWEAQREIDNHKNDWKPGGTLAGASTPKYRLFNNHQRAGHSFNRGGYKDSNKCNLFVNDICLRAGFCAVIHNTGTNWHYLDANSIANAIHQAAGSDARVHVPGRAEDAGAGWAWKVENWLRSQPAPISLRALLNAAITEQGRCFILAGARRQLFAPRALPGGAKGVASCRSWTNGGSLRNRGIGHIVIVNEVLAEPQLKAVRGEGFQRIRVDTLEASGAGAESRGYDAQCSMAAGDAAGSTGFIRLHLFEVQPGGDPDTLQGLRSLNVRQSNNNLLGTASERAPNRGLTHNLDGTTRPAGRCCQDDQQPLVPTRDGTEVAC